LRSDSIVLEILGAIILSDLYLTAWLHENQNDALSKAIAFLTPRKLVD
jgi:hypothetical protein